MKNALIEYIKSHPNWEAELQAEPYNLFVRTSDDAGFENMYLFTYNQIKSDMTDEVVQTCRGIIVDMNDEPKVVCFPFSKFFNFNDARAHEIDWASASVQEKVDGSIMKLWYNNRLRKWVWSTNGTINAMNTDLPTDAGPVSTFGALAESAFNNIFRGGFPDNLLDIEDTYIFELTSPWNRVVVPHAETGLTLLGIRNNERGHEFPVDGYSTYFNIPKRYSYNSFEEMTEAAAALPYDEEGYVVCDKNFNRVKVKSLAYLQVHHLADNGNVSRDRMLTLIRTGEDGELLKYYPEYTEVFEEIRELWQNHLTKVEEIKVRAAELAKKSETRKDYAMEVLKAPKAMHPYFFCLLDGKEDRLEELMSKLTADKLFRIEDSVTI